MSTSDAPDWSNAVAVTGSLPAAGPVVGTVPVTLGSVVSIIESAGTQFIIGSGNASLGPGASYSANPPALSGSQFWVLDFFSCYLPATTAANDLEGYIAIGNLKMVDLFSLTSGLSGQPIVLGGIPAPSGSNVVIALHNASGSNTYLGIKIMLVGRTVTP